MNSRFQQLHRSNHTTQKSREVTDEASRQQNRLQSHPDQCERRRILEGHRGIIRPLLRPGQDPEKDPEKVMSRQNRNVPGKGDRFTWSSLHAASTRCSAPCGPKSVAGGNSPSVQ
mgnify:CR=1 FL=1